MYNSLHRWGGRWLLLGALAAGHAQITQSPDTVAPGRFLLEANAISLTINHDPGLDYRAFGTASAFLTTGLTATWDVQAGAEVFIDQKFNTHGLSDRRSGLGDLYVRTKWRFYEDESAGTALAVMPYAKLPTATGGVGSSALEGGVIMPWKAALAGGFRLTAMGELDFLRNTGDNGYDTFWYGAMALHRPLTKALDLFGELTAGKSTGGAPWTGQAGVGATLRVTDNASWGYALYRGLFHAASIWSPVVRFSYGF